MYGNPGGVAVGGGGLLAITGGEISTALIVAAALFIGVGALCLLRTRMLRRAEAN